MQDEFRKAVAGVKPLKRAKRVALRHPAPEPVLKSKLRGWLTARGEVLAFSPAPAAHGGAGAVLVLLKA